MAKIGWKAIMGTKEWKEIKDLKPIDRFISGQSYSLDFTEQYMPQEKERIKRLRRAKMNVIYSVDFCDWEKDNVTVEEMGYRTKYVGESLYLMVTGNIYDKKN